MRKLVIFVLFFLFTLFYFKQETYAYSCIDRNPSCPTSTYPTCQTAVSECNPPGCLVAMYQKDGKYVLDCAFPAAVTPPIPGQNWCGWQNGNFVNNCSPGYWPRVTYNGGRSCQCWSNAVPTPIVGPVIGPGFKIDTCPGKPDTINTAIGCIPTTFAGFATFFLGYLLGIAGVVAFFLIIIAGFQILTSGGNPEKLEGAKQLLTAAVIGLFFIIFSVLLLQIIGYRILDLRGFVKFE